jgi:hypothetical protein
VTEPIYFEYFCASLQLSTVRVKVQPGDASDPRHVIRTADREAKAQIHKARKGQLAIDEPPKFDHVWAVIDTDVAVRNGIWNDIVQLAAGKKISLAHSTPCFEFWLLLHLGMTTRGDLVNGEAAKSALKSSLGNDYSTNEETAREALKSLVKSWPQAVRHASQVRHLHMEARTPGPANPSTDVDLLAMALNYSALEHLRQL